MTEPRHGLPAYLAAHVSPDTRYHTLPGPFALERGDSLDDVTVAYRTWGDPRNAGRTILVCHALTGSADVDAWWPGVIGEDGAFDPDTDYVICSNILGSCYGTTGPASLMPDGSRRYRSRFPRVTVRDMVRAQARLLDHLGVDEIDVVIGPSLGAMQVLEWALEYPERVRSIVPIGVGGRHSPWCIAMTEAQRAAIYADPHWAGGEYGDDLRPEQGLAAARMMAICSYRSWDSFESRFGRELRSTDEFQVQSYLRHQGRKINDRFDANAYVRLTQAMNDHDVSRGRGQYADVLRSITQPALVVSVSSDVLYPPAEQALLAEHMPNAGYEILETEHGHDGFLIQTQELAATIRRFRSAAAASPGRAPVTLLSAAR
jgi:homoserine O-acetyltransferase